jgi:staphylococcal nuclease domain-containing protein 1
MPADSQAFVSEWKGKSLEGKYSFRFSHCRFLSFSHLALVEQVRDGSTLRVRLFMPDGEHQTANIALAGIRCPRAAGKQGEASEQWGEEVRYLTSLCSLVD